MTCRITASTPRALCFGALLACFVACGGFRYEPMSERDPADSRAPTGPSVSGDEMPAPEPALEHNPLAEPHQLSVVCNPQGTPLIETPETRACEAESDCRIVCE